MSEVRQETGGMVFTLSIVAVLFIAAALVVLSFFLLRLVMPPLKQITESMRVTSEGAGDLTKKLVVSSKDEIGDLSRYFNLFIDRVRMIIVHLIEIGARSKEMGRILTENSHEVSVTSEQIAATMNPMAERINELYSEINASNTSVQAIDGAVKTVVGLIDEQAASVNESSAAIQEMISNIVSIEKTTDDKKKLIDQLTNMADEGGRSIESTVQSIKQITEASETIGSLVTVINKVANQTNLLALNAAIEAVHAGEFGKGFSVVAEEIRKLAEATTGNAKGISQTLKDIPGKVKTASNTARHTDLVFTDLLKGIADVAESLNETLLGLKEIASGSTQITSSLSELNQLTSDIRTTGREIQVDTGRIESAMKKTFELGSNNKDGIEGISAGALDITKSISALTELSLENMKNIEKIEEEIARFKVD